MYKITLPEPLKVNGEAITTVTLTRMPTVADLGDYSVVDVIVDQKPKAIAHVVSAISEPFIPVSAIMNGASVNLMTMGGGINAFLDQVSGLGQIEKVEVAQSKENLKRPTH